MSISVELLAERAIASYIDPDDEPTSDGFERFRLRAIARAGDSGDAHLMELVKDRSRLEDLYQNLLEKKAARQENDKQRAEFETMRNSNGALVRDDLASKITGSAGLQFGQHELTQEQLSQIIKGEIVLPLPDADPIQSMEAKRLGELIGSLLALIVDEDGTSLLDKVKQKSKRKRNREFSTDGQPAAKRPRTTTLSLRSTGAPKKVPEPNTGTQKFLDSDPLRQNPSFERGGFSELTLQALQKFLLEHLKSGQVLRREKKVLRQLNTDVEAKLNLSRQDLLKNRFELELAEKILDLTTDYLRKPRETTRQDALSALTGDLRLTLAGVDVPLEVGEDFAAANNQLNFALKGRRRSEADEVLEETRKEIAKARQAGGPVPFDKSLDRSSKNGPGWINPPALTKSEEDWLKKNRPELHKSYLRVVENSEGNHSAGMCARLGRRKRQVENLEILRKKREQTASAEELAELDKDIEDARQRYRDERYMKNFVRTTYFAAGDREGKNSLMLDLNQYNGIISKLDRELAEDPKQSAARVERISVREQIFEHLEGGLEALDLSLKSGLTPEQLVAPGEPGYKKMRKGALQRVYNEGQERAKVFLFDGKEGPQSALVAQRDAAGVNLMQVSERLKKEGKPFEDNPDFKKARHEYLNLEIQLRSHKRLWNLEHRDTQFDPEKAASITIEKVATGNEISIVRDKGGPLASTSTLSQNERERIFSSEPQTLEEMNVRGRSLATVFSTVSSASQVRYKSYFHSVLPSYWKPVGLYRDSGFAKLSAAERYSGTLDDAFKRDFHPEQSNLYASESDAKENRAEANATMRRMVGATESLVAQLLAASDRGHGL